MRIYEYRKHLIDGQLRDPDFITNGGHWHLVSNDSYIAVMPDSVRWYLPDTLIMLTADDLAQRLLTIHSADPFPAYQGVPGSGGTQLGRSMTESEVRTMLSQWLDHMNAMLV